MAIEPITVCGYLTGRRAGTSRSIPFRGGGQRIIKRQVLLTCSGALANLAPCSIVA